MEEEKKKAKYRVVPVMNDEVSTAKRMKNIFYFIKKKENLSHDTAEIKLGYGDDISDDLKEVKTTAISDKIIQNLPEEDKKIMTFLKIRDFEYQSVINKKRILELLTETKRAYVYHNNALNPLLVGDTKEIYTAWTLNKREASRGIISQIVGYKPWDRSDVLVFGHNYIDFTNGIFGKVKKYDDKPEIVENMKNIGIVTIENIEPARAICTGHYSPMKINYTGIEPKCIIEYSKNKKETYNYEIKIQYDNIYENYIDNIMQLKANRTPVKIVEKNNQIYVLNRTKEETIYRRLMKSNFYPFLRKDLKKENIDTLSKNKKLLNSLRDNGIEILFNEEFQTIDRIENFKIDFEADTESGWWFDITAGIKVGDKIVDIIPFVKTFLKEYGELPTLDDITNLAKGRNSKTITLYDENKNTLNITPKALHELIETLKNAVGITSIKTGKANALQPTIDGAAKKLEKFIPDEIFKIIDYKNKTPVRYEVVGLNGKLRDYQEVGFNWMTNLALSGLGGILADDMGLGKTIQVLSHILYMRSNGHHKTPVLLVVPKTLIGNWKAETEKFANQLSICVYHGGQKNIDLSSDIIMTTYGTLHENIDNFLDTKWSALFLDEAQNTKTIKAQTTLSLYKIQKDYCICMSGTPVENNLSELWSLMSISVPKLLGTFAWFKKQFITPIEKQGDLATYNMLTEIISPFVVRRTKKEVATELPDKIIVEQYIEFEDKQRSVYETIRIMMNKKIRELMADKPAGSASMLVIEALLRLRQTCCHTDLLKNPEYPSVSAKMEYLKEVLPEMIEEGKKILIFSQFTEMLEIIEHFVNEIGVPYLRLDGATNNRQELVNKFQKGLYPVFLISLKAGGVGLNLTAADTVIHFDPWWNAAAENQATDRAYRIGQDKNVTVYKLIMKDSVEEKVVNLQKKKEKLAGVVDGKQIPFAKEDMLSLFDL